MRYQGFSRPDIKWSLTPETARAVFAVKHGAGAAYNRDYRRALELSREFKPTGTFDSFLAVNGIELVG